MTNTLFPGRPDYAGPKTGVFGLLHHDMLVETSHNVFERVTYIKKNKPPHEVQTRLHNMIYLGGCEAAVKCAPLYADYEAKRAPLYAEYSAKRCTPVFDEILAAIKCAMLDDDYRAKCIMLDADYKAKCAPLYDETLAYIKTHIPDCAWNGATLVFTEGGSK